MALHIIIIIIIFVIVIIIIILLHHHCPRYLYMQGTYTYIPVTKHVLSEHCVTTILM